MVQHEFRGCRLAILVILLACSAATAAPFDPSICPTNLVRRGEDGPYDYRSVDPRAQTRRRQVESNHFNEAVRSLRMGQTAAEPGLDIEFLLAYVPNHPQALKAMMDLAALKKTERPIGAKMTVTCYFEYAKLFAPDDGVIRTLYGIYLARNGQTKRAVQELESASQLSPNNANVQYNLGLTYFEVGDFERSLRHAHAAYALGFPLPGLKSKLQKAGKWREPAPLAASVPPSGDTLSDPQKPQ